MSVETLRGSAAITKLEYRRLRAQLEFRPNPGMNVLTIGLNVGLFGFVFWLLTCDAAPAYWIAQVLLPIGMFQAFAILHECGHGSFSKSRLVNSLVGHYASVLCCMPYLPWKYVHTEHHVWAGNVDHDPGLAIVRRARAGDIPKLVALVWRTWVPLIALAQHFVYWLYPLTEFRRGKLRGARLWLCAGSVAVKVAAYAAFHALAPESLTLASFAPGIVLYLVMVELVNVPHHAGLTAFDTRLPLWEQHLPTRSCDYPPVISEVLMLNFNFNFNFHIEHHLFPNLPWYRMRAARNLIAPQLGVRYRQTRGFNWLIRARKRTLIDLVTQSADDFESVRPAEHQHEVSTT